MLGIRAHAMIITPMFAEALGGWLMMAVVLGFILVGFGIASLVCIPVIAGDGRGTLWGLCLGLFFALGGGFLFVGSFNAGGGGVPLFYRIAAAVPMSCGLISLYLWGLGRKHWPDTVLRIVLYGLIIVTGLCLFALWVRRPY